MNREEIIEKLKSASLKVTPQRIAVLESILILKNHPTAENITTFIKQSNPNIAVGTVYNILETLVGKGIVMKVKTDSDQMRYEAVAASHHHLYCIESDRIEDYYDNTLNDIIQDYLRKKKIPNFTVNDIKLQLVGRFSDRKK